MPCEKQFVTTRWRTIWNSEKNGVGSSMLVNFVQPYASYLSFLLFGLTCTQSRKLCL